MAGFEFFRNNLSGGGLKREDADGRNRRRTAGQRRVGGKAGGGEGSWQGGGNGSGTEGG